MLLGIQPEQGQRLAFVEQRQRALFVVGRASSWPSIYTRMKPSNFITWPVARKIASADSISTVVRSYTAGVIWLETKRL